MELHFEYYVIEFLHQPYIDVERLVVVPACWMEANVYGTGDRRVAVSYPAVHSPHIIRYVREKKTPHRDWTWHCAVIKFGNDDFNEAQKYIVRNSNKQKRKVCKTSGKKSVTPASKRTMESLNYKLKDLKVLIPRLPMLEPSWKRTGINISEKGPNVERPTVIKTTKSLLDTTNNNKLSGNPDTNESIEVSEKSSKKQLSFADDIKNINKTASTQSKIENKLFPILENSSARSLTPHNESESHLKLRDQEIINNSPINMSLIEQAHAANIPLNPKSVYLSPINTSVNGNLHTTISKNHLIQNTQENLLTNISETKNIIKEKNVTQKTMTNELKKSDVCVNFCVKPNKQKQCHQNNEIIDVDDSQQITTNNKPRNVFTTSFNPCAQIADQLQAIDYRLHKTEILNVEAQIEQYIIQTQHSPAEKELLHDLNKIIKYYQSSILQPTVSNNTNTENHTQNIFDHIIGPNQQTHHPELFSEEQFKRSLKELLRNQLLPRYGRTLHQYRQQNFNDNKKEKCAGQESLSQAQDMMNDRRKIMRNLDLISRTPTIPINAYAIDTENHQTHYAQYNLSNGLNQKTQNSTKPQVLPKNIFPPRLEISNQTNTFNNNIHQKSFHQGDTIMSNNANKYAVDPGKVIIKKVIKVKPMPSTDSDYLKKDQVAINGMSITQNYNNQEHNKRVDCIRPVQAPQDHGESVTKQLRIEDIIFSEINKLKKTDTTAKPKITEPPILNMPSIFIEENTTGDSLHKLNTISVSSEGPATNTSEKCIVAANIDTPGYKNSALMNLLLQKIDYKRQHDKNKNIKNNSGNESNVNTLTSKETNNNFNCNLSTPTGKDNLNTEVNSVKINRNTCERDNDKSNDDVVCIDDINVFTTTTKGTECADESISTIFNIDEDTMELIIDESFNDIEFTNDNNDFISISKEKSTNATNNTVEINNRNTTVTNKDESQNIVMNKDGNHNMVINKGGNQIMLMNKYGSQYNNMVTNNVKSQNMEINNDESKKTVTNNYETQNTLQRNRNESLEYIMRIDDDKSFTKTSKANDVRQVYKQVLPPECDLSNTKWTLKHPTAGPGLVELIVGSRVYINERRLNYCLAKARNYNILGRKLLLEVFNYNALKVCYFNKGPSKSLNKPELDLHGKEAILEFLRLYGQAKGWPKMLTAAVILSLRNKLHELRIKYNLINYRKLKTT